MNTFYRGLLLICFVALLSSCDVQNSTPEPSSERFTISNDAETLSQRLEMVNQPLTGSKANTVSTNNFRHLSNVEAPEVRGRTLSATAVHINGHYAYVTYQLNGVDYGGALEIIDITDKNNPRIVSLMTIDDTDLNDVTLNNAGTFAYVTGGRQQSSSGYDGEGHNGAIAAEIEIQNDSTVTSNIRETPLPSFSGNSIEISGSNFVVSTGGTGGGFYVLDTQNFSVQKGVDRDLARHIDIEGNDIIGLALNQANSNTSKLYRLNANSNTVDSLDTQLTVQPEDGKNVIDLRNDLVYTALSNQGYKVYDFSNPSSPVASFDLQGGGLANGLDAGDDYLYMAAGMEGLYVADLPNLNQVFNFDNEQGSANYVEADGGFIFLAKGIDGLNILGQVNDENTDPTVCPFDANDGTVINFQNNRIASNRSNDEARTDLANASLSQGTYRVKLYGYDDHRNDGIDRGQQNQQNESFFVSLLQGGSEVAQTGVLGDLPDDSDLGTRMTTINNFQLSSDVDQVQGVHAGDDGNGGPNSLNAQCVAFEKTN